MSQEKISGLEEIFVAAGQKAISKIFEKIRTDALKEEIALHGERDWLKRCFGGSLPTVVQAHCDSQDATRDARTFGDLREDDTVAVFVTISPNGADPDELLKSAAACFKKCSCVASVLFSIEQSGRSYTWPESGEPGPTNVGYHPHIHGLLWLPHSKSGERSEIKKRVTYHFKKYVTKSESACIDLKAVSLSSEESKVAYVKGDKDDVEKQELCKIDRYWRAKMGYRPFYTSDLTTTPEIEEEFDPPSEEEEPDEEEPWDDDDSASEGDRAEATGSDSDDISERSETG